MLVFVYNCSTKKCYKMNNKSTFLKFNSLTKKLGIVVFFMAITSLVFFDSIIEFLKLITERYIDVDGKVDSNQVFSLKLMMTLSVFILFIISLFIFLGINLHIKARLNSIIDFKRLRFFLLTDPLSTKSKHLLRSIILSVLASIIMHLYFLLYGEPEQEGYIETFSSLFFLFAIFILIATLIKSKKIDLNKRNKHVFTIYIILLICGLTFIYGEELSWGQHFFKWDSSTVFNNYNIQQETNVHNFFNPIYRFMYPIIGMGSFLFFCLFWFFSNPKKPKIIQLLLPHPSLFFIGFLMACSTFNGHSEIYEELMGLFIFLYSIRLLICMAFPSKILKAESRTSGN
jgi:hypothetical protein